MKIEPFQSQHIPAAAELFSANCRELRRAVPVLPDLMEHPAHVSGYLEWLLGHHAGLVALEGERLLGFLGWMLVERFRDTERKAAYCPEWGHATVKAVRTTIYRALYREAARQWREAGCHAHALTILAHEGDTLGTWFWNGFGLTVVDAVRSLEPLGTPNPAGAGIRRASPQDAPDISVLEIEHRRHYSQAPVFMAPHRPYDAVEIGEFLQTQENSYWLAEEGGELLGFIRFEGRGEGAAAVVAEDTTIAITGAYFRPERRGGGLASAVLNVALQDYARLGFERCSVDFESFNPEAAGFWMKYFQPVCYSLVRVPET
jgi:ribosomal protein S18 acetylase RimI-like enzyme